MVDEWDWRSEKITPQVFRVQRDFWDKKFRRAENSKECSWNDREGGAVQKEMARVAERRFERNRGLANCAIDMINMQRMVRRLEAKGC